MKKIVLFVVSLLLCHFALAQGPSAGTLQRYRSGIKDGGVVLSPSQVDSVLTVIGGPAAVADWQTLASRRKTGIWLTAGGSALAGGGALMAAGTGLVYVVGIIFVGPAAAISDDSQKVVDDYGKGFKPWLYGSLAAAGAGVAALGVGIPVLVKANRGMSGMLVGSEDVEVAFGATTDGIGLKVTF